MTRDALLAEIRKLPLDEQLKLIELVQDEIALPDDAPMPEWHREELDRRLNDPAGATWHTWEDVQRSLGIPPK